LTITLKDSLLFLDLHRLKINVKINVIKVNFGLAQRFHHAHVNTNKSSHSWLKDVWRKALTWQNYTEEPGMNHEKSKKK